MGAPGMPHVPAQRPANPEYPASRNDQPTNPEYGREHFTGPLRSNRSAQHRATDEEAADSDRTVAIPRPGEGNHPANAETMVLPVFVTGKKEPEPAPAPAQPARQPGADGSLPASERGMLVFVAALLGIGTVAVVVMLGLGGLEKHPAQIQPTAPASTGPAGGVPAPAASPSSLSPSPTAPGSPSTAASPTLAKTTAKHIAPPAPVLLGQPQPLAYCVAKDHGLAQAPGHDHNTWTCTTGRHGQADPFTPEQVCDWQYGTAAHAVVGSLADYTTWKCYK
ncbi:hypothetical protein [Rugosimonospora africana]|uniref:hypothetical protein n=1 Tax=Rugosimonospora africana TaxID=556532 RepID=UPI001944B7B6|nr:hypothetical protein [Rugosimonospora africana]